MSASPSRGTSRGDHDVERLGSEEVSALRSDLLGWYGRAHRQLPWRSEPSPYRVWLSEIMLQQTRVETVVSYFERFVDRFPDLQALAAAPLDDVLALWSGLGYYSRARNFHSAVTIVAREHGGVVPSDPAALRELPGVGRYTAGAIASIAFGVPAPIVDGNVIRLLTRLYDIPDEVGSPATLRRLWALADQLVCPEDAGAFNQAMMELGALICTPRSPCCGECPLSGVCAANHAGTVGARPVKAKRKPPTLLSVVAALCRDRDGSTLFVQRPHEGLFGGMWELPQQSAPGSRSGATVRDVVARRVGLEVSATGACFEATHVLSHRKMQIRVHECVLEDQRPVPQLEGYVGYLWVDTRPQLRELGLGAVTVKMLDAAGWKGAPQVRS